MISGMSEKFGFIITIEKYQTSTFGLPTVEYATNDGEAIKDIFINTFGIDESNIHHFIDDEFTYTTGISELKYYLKSLPKEAEVYFYYAGHGFFYEGKNYITAYDSKDVDVEHKELVASSIPMEECIFDVVKSAGVKSFIAFIDACAEGISSSCRGIGARGIEMAATVFDGDSSCRCAVYFACSPNEKAIPDDELKHGVWTWFLIKALQGDEKAFDKGKCITTNSLQEYLRRSVREFTRLRNKQTPYSVVSSSGNWKLVDYSDDFSFEDGVLFAYGEFLFQCNTVNQELAIGLYEDIHNFAQARDLCWEISDKLCPEWEAIVACLEFCVIMLDRGKALNLTYTGQKEMLEDFEMLINSFPTYINECTSTSLF